MMFLRFFYVILQNFSYYTYKYKYQMYRKFMLVIIIAITQTTMTFAQTANADTIKAFKTAQKAQKMLKSGNPCDSRLTRRRLIQFEAGLSGPLELPRAAISCFCEVL